jgi:hypothetical protein
MGVVAVRPISSDDPLAAVSRLNASFEQGGIPYWLFGGWAVDFHVGQVTRDHADIDIAVWQTDLISVGALLRADGWLQTPGQEDDGYTSYTRGALHLDLAFLARDAQGIVYTPLKAGRGEWPPNSFEADICDLAGTRAHVVSLASLVTDKSDLREDVGAATKDAADVAVLRSVETNGRISPAP